MNNNNNPHLPGCSSPTQFQRVSSIIDSFNTIDDNNILSASIPYSQIAQNRSPESLVVPAAMVLKRTPLAPVNNTMPSSGSGSGSGTHPVLKRNPPDQVKSAVAAQMLPKIFYPPTGAKNSGSTAKPHPVPMHIPVHTLDADSDIENKPAALLRELRGNLAAKNLLKPTKPVSLAKEQKSPHIIPKPKPEVPASTPRIHVCPDVTPMDFVNHVDIYPRRPTGTITYVNTMRSNPAITARRPYQWASEAHLHRLTSEPIPDPTQATPKSSVHVFVPTPPPICTELESETETCDSACATTGVLEPVTAINVEADGVPETEGPDMNTERHEKVRDIMVTNITAPSQRHDPSPSTYTSALDNQEFIEMLQLNILSVTSFLNEFHQSVRSRLNTMSSKLARIERNMERVESFKDRVTATHQHRE